MTATTMTNKAVLEKGTKAGRLSLRERFARYIEENGVQIACGLMALNGDSNAYRTYAMLTEER